MKNDYGKALLVWLLGILGLILIDALLRGYTGKPHELGMPEALWFGLPIAWAGVAGWVVSAAWRKNRRWQTLARMAVTAAGAGVLYVVAVWLYVVMTGIDAV